MIQTYHNPVLSLYLSENPKRMIEAYNAVYKKCYPLDTPVEIHSLRDVWCDDCTDGIFFQLKGRLVVVSEYRPAVDKNLPLKMLMYLRRIYERILSATSIYQEKQTKIPAPEFLALYHGDEPYPLETLLRLSDSFSEDGAHETFLEIPVKVINIRAAKNNPVLRQSQSLREYSFLMDSIRSYRKKGAETKDAIHAAVAECKKRGVMLDFLAKYANEIECMLFLDFAWNDALAKLAKEAPQEV